MWKNDRFFEERDVYKRQAQTIPGGAAPAPTAAAPPLPHAPGAEREQDTAAAERVLERIDGARTRKASKKAARKAQAEATAKEKSSRLQFTDEERATPELERPLFRSIWKNVALKMSVETLLISRTT